MTITNTEIPANQKASIQPLRFFPEDMIYLGSIFGGKLFAEMEKAAFKHFGQLLYTPPFVVGRQLLVWIKLISNARPIRAIS